MVIGLPIGVLAEVVITDDGLPVGVLVLDSDVGVVSVMEGEDFGKRARVIDRPPIFPDSDEITKITPPLSGVSFPNCLGFSHDSVGSVSKSFLRQSRQKES